MEPATPTTPSTPRTPLSPDFRPSFTEDELHHFRRELASYILTTAPRKRNTLKRIRPELPGRFHPDSIPDEEELLSHKRVRSLVGALVTGMPDRPTGFGRRGSPLPPISGNDLLLKILRTYPMSFSVEFLEAWVDNPALVERIASAGKESACVAVAEVFRAGTLPSERREEERAVLDQHGGSLSCLESELSFVLLGNQVPMDVVGLIFDFYGYSYEGICCVGLVSYDFFALLLSRWKGTLFVTRTNLSTIPLTVFRNVECVKIGHARKRKALRFGHTQLESLFGQKVSIDRLRELSFEETESFVIERTLDRMFKLQVHLPNLTKIEFQSECFSPETRPDWRLGEVAPQITDVRFPNVEWCREGPNCPSLKLRVLYFSLAEGLDLRDFREIVSAVEELGIIGDRNPARVVGLGDLDYIGELIPGLQRLVLKDLRNVNAFEGILLPMVNLESLLIEGVCFRRGYHHGGPLYPDRQPRIPALLTLPAVRALRFSTGTRSLKAFPDGFDGDNQVRLIRGHLDQLSSLRLHLRRPDIGSFRDWKSDSAVVACVQDVLLPRIGQFELLTLTTDASKVSISQGGRVIRFKSHHSGVVQKQLTNSLSWIEKSLIPRCGIRLRRLEASVWSDQFSKLEAPAERIRRYMNAVFKGKVASVDAESFHFTTKRYIVDGAGRGARMPEIFSCVSLEWCLM